MPKGDYASGQRNYVVIRVHQIDHFMDYLINPFNSQKSLVATVSDREMEAHSPSYPVSRPAESHTESASQRIGASVSNLQ